MNSFSVATLVSFSCLLFAQRGTSQEEEINSSRAYNAFKPDYKTIPDDRLLEHLCHRAKNLGATKRVFSAQSEYQSEDARRTYQKENKQKLLKKLRWDLLELIMEHQTSTAPFASLGGHRPAPISDDCPNLSETYASSYSKLLDRYAKLQTIPPNFLKYKVWPMAFKLHANFAFRALFLKKILMSAGWQSSTLRPPGVEKMDLSFPAFYQSAFSREKVSPSSALAMIHDQYPLLNEPAEPFLGIAKENISSPIFREIFLPDSEKGQHLTSKPITKYLLKELQPHIQKIYEVLINEPGTRNKLEQEFEQFPELAKFMTIDQRIFLLTWEVFLNYFFDSFVADKVLKIANPTPKVTRLFFKAAVRRSQNLTWAKRQACEMPDDGLQDIQGLMSLRLAKITNPEEKLKELEAFCRTRWASRSKMTEAIGQTAWGASMLLGMVAPPATRPAIIGASTMISGASALLHARQSYVNGLIEQSVFQKTLNERNEFAEFNILNFSLVLLSPAFTWSLSNHVAKDPGKYLNVLKWDRNTKIYSAITHFGGNGLSAVKYLNNNINPLTRKEYWVGFFSGAFSTIGFAPLLQANSLTTAGQVLLAMISMGINVAVDKSFQSIQFLLTNEEVDPRVISYRLQFGAVKTAEQLAFVQVLEQLNKLTDRVFSGSSKANAWTTAVATIVNSWLLGSFETESQIRYLENYDTSVAESMFATRLEDFLLDLNKEVGIEENSDTIFALSNYLKNSSHAELQHLRNLFSAFTIAKE